MATTTKKTALGKVTTIQKANSKKRSSLYEKMKDIKPDKELGKLIEFMVKNEKK